MKPTQLYDLLLAATQGFAAGHRRVLLWEDPGPRSGGSAQDDLTTHYLHDLAGAVAAVWPREPAAAAEGLRLERARLRLAIEAVGLDIVREGRALGLRPTPGEVVGRLLAAVPD